MGGFRDVDPDTCRRAYEQIKDDGTLSARRLEAIACLSQATAPPTVGEMALVMHSNRNNLATRMSELEHLGVVTKVGERECKVSGKECITWWMTGKQPEGEIPKNINTTEIVRGQRDRAMETSQKLDKLIHGVIKWLELPGDISEKRRAQGASKLRARLKEITGETE